MNTLFDKIWDAHVVQEVKEGPTQLYIDRLYCHEVTSPQAFSGMRARGLKCFRPERIYCMPDHNTPTHDQDKPIEDPVSKAQVDALPKCGRFRADSLRNDGQAERNHPRGRSGTRTDFAGNDHCLRGLPYFHSRRDGRCGVRYRNQ